MNGIVRTVLGDVPAHQLGRTDIHEHLLMSSPLLPGEELADVEASTNEATRLRRAGIDALVELTPLGLGRDPEGLATIALRSGLRVVLATGLLHTGHYPEDHWAQHANEEQLAAAFQRDITTGCASALGPAVSSHRAGVIKAGTGYWSISTIERRFLRAAATAQHATGAAIICHLEQGSAGMEVLELLRALGVPAGRIAFAHMDRNLDPGVHSEIAAEGAYVCYDGPGRTKDWPDSMLLECLLRVIEAGHGTRLLLGADVARRSRFQAHGGLPGLEYLPRRFVPRLRTAAGDEATDTILSTNPARLLALDAGS